ncbi:MAG: RluA family pseudouridine synthase [Xanthomonadaceae bacterium]|nr:RluA family pseudouridine synthase [Rhodospirillaceae bacterium]NIA18124.1 RluA family pseudouridine synthase [Xanthomonadaceae bacterium]
MIKQNKIIIDEKQAGIRIDKFLAKKFTEYSRSFWQSVIADGFVLLNKKNKSAHYKLKINDIISINFKEVDKIFKKREISLKPDKKIKFKIVFENNDFIIINKPVGLVVHPTESCPKNTLVNGLLAYYPKIKNVGDNFLRPGIVHRLDKGVSGLMIVAKNQESFLYFKDQFGKRKIEKKYLALVYGKISKDSGEINLKIGRNKNGLVTTGMTGKYKEAKTLFSVIKRFRNFTFLEAQILTGRTHQIRVHLKAIDHPIVGDNIYFLKKYQKFNIFGLKRIFLHSYKLEFADKTGEQFNFEKKLPPELKEIIEKKLC